MPHAYVAKPAVVPETFLPPGWNPIWPWEDENSVEPPGYDPGSPVLFAHDPDDPIPPTYRVVYRVGLNSDYGGIDGAIVRQQGTLAFPLQMNYAEWAAAAAKVKIVVDWAFFPDGSRVEYGSQTSSSDGFECEVSQTGSYAFEMTISEVSGNYSYIFTAQCAKYEGFKIVQSYDSGDGYWHWVYKNPPFETQGEAISDFNRWLDTFYYPDLPTQEERDARWAENFTWVFDAFSDKIEVSIDPPTWTITVYKTTYKIVNEEVVGTEAWLCGYEIIPPVAGTFPLANTDGVILGYDAEAVGQRFHGQPWLGIKVTRYGLSVLGQQYTGGNQYSYNTTPYRTLDFTT